VGVRARHLGLAVIVFVLMTGPPAAAVINKVSADHCKNGKCATVKSLVETILGDDTGDTEVVILAVLAAFFLLAIMCALSGVAMAGAQGGLERLAAGVVGPLVVLMMLGFVL
jgi:ABC-type Na+ efflux pump permease subunit